MKRHYFSVVIAALIICAATTVVFQRTQSGYKNFHRGLLHYNRGKYSKAVQYLEKVPPQQRQYPNALYYLVMSFNKLEDKSRLAETLENFSKINQSNIKNVEWLGDTYYGLEKYDLAQKYYQSFLEKSPDSYNVRRKLTEVLVWQKNYEEAVGILQTQMKDRPQDYKTKELLADVYAWSADYDNAIKLYKELLENKKGDEKKALVLKLAETLRYAGRNAEAIELYNKYIDDKGNL
ncbi:MAG: tetratricopeptide repeat protein [Phycisphaerae bacterium]|nr:tetratricopeptide repeat protein [Phycisphaerae bacterium]